MFLVTAALVLALRTDAERPPREVLTLRGARQVFLVTDRNGSGVLERAEAKALGWGGYSLRIFDQDSSGSLDLEEVVVALRERASAEGRHVTTELAAEATRILAERRARSAERAGSRVVRGRERLLRERGRSKQRASAREQDGPKEKP